MQKINFSDDIKSTLVLILTVIVAFGYVSIDNGIKLVFIMLPIIAFSGFSLWAYNHFYTRTVKI